MAKWEQRYTAVFHCSSCAVTLSSFLSIRCHRFCFLLLALPFASLFAVALYCYIIIVINFLCVLPWISFDSLAPQPEKQNATNTTENQNRVTTSEHTSTWKHQVKLIGSAKHLQLFDSMSKGEEGERERKKTKVTRPKTLFTTLT